MSIAPPDGAARDTRPPWQWWSGLLAIVAALFATLVVGLVIDVAAAAFGADVTDPPPGILLLSTVAQEVCFVGAALLFANSVRPVRPWQFGLRPTAPRRAVAYVVAAYLTSLVVNAVWFAALGISQDDSKLTDQLGADASTLAAVGVAILTCVLAPVAEEVLFRGYLFPALRNRIGLRWAVGATGALFGLIHAGSAPVGFLPPLAVFGALLCLVYVRTGSLYPCIALHCLNNSIAYGVSIDWDWQIPIVFVGSLTLLGAAAVAVRRRAGPDPAYLSPV